MTCCEGYTLWAPSGISAPLYSSYPKACLQLDRVCDVCTRAGMAVERKRRGLAVIDGSTYRVRRVRDNG